MSLVIAVTALDFNIVFVKMGSQAMSSLVQVFKTLSNDLLIISLMKVLTSKIVWGKFFFMLTVLALQC